MKAATLLACLAGFLAIVSTAGAQGGTTSVPSATTSTPRAKIDLNTADIPTLESLPEIGTDFANAVVGGRPYHSVDDMAKKIKLPTERLKTLGPKVIVSAPKPTASTPSDPRTSRPTKPPQANDGKATSAQEVTERYDRETAKNAGAKK